MADLDRSSAKQLEAVLTAERSILGAAIVERSGRQAGILAEFVSEAEFVSPLNRAVFAAIRRLLARGAVPLEYASVIAELQAAGMFESYSNAYSLISSLGEGVVLARPMTRRIAELRAMWSRRREAAAK